MFIDKTTKEVLLQGNKSNAWVKTQRFSKTNLNSAMLIIRISLELYGNSFSPKNLLDRLQDSFKVFSSHEPSDIKWEDKPEQYEFGFISILHPNEIGIQSELLNYEKWYVEFLEKNYKAFTDSGVDDLTLLIEVFYKDQCNFEIFDKSLLKRLVNYHISMPISVYNLTAEQISSLLYDAGYGKQIVDQIIEEG